MASNESELNVVLSYKRKNEVFLPNGIVESQQGFSEIEKKIMTFVINQLGVLESPIQSQSLTVMIPLSELTTSNNHAKIRKAAESIQKKQITLSLPQTKNNSFIPFDLVSLYSVAGRDFLKVEINSKVAALFVASDLEFTQYGLKTMLKMSSMYSQRMYEILMMYVSRKQTAFSYSVEQLRFMLNCPESYGFNELRKRALLTSQLEIAKKAGLDFDFQALEKDGKKVLSIIFVIRSTLKKMEEVIYEALHQADASKQSFLLRLQNEYRFTKQQQTEIIHQTELFETFVNLDRELFLGTKKNINPTLYIQKKLGFVIRRGPKPKK